jgi:hypothetical protein
MACSLFIGFCELVLSDGMVEVLVTLVELKGPHVATTNLLAGLAAAGSACCCAASLRPSARCSRTTTFGG